MNYLCINCLEPANTLYQKYSSEVIRLTECKKCGHIVDKYIEYDEVLIVLDLIMQYSKAYRHFVYNSQPKNFFRLVIILIFCGAYDKWITERSRFGTESNIYDLELIFYRSLLRSAIEMLIFVVCISIREIFHSHSTDRLSFVARCCVFGFYGKVAVVLSIIFRLSSTTSYRLAIEIFLFLSHLQIQRTIYHKTPMAINFAFAVLPITLYLCFEYFLV